MAKTLSLKFKKKRTVFFLRLQVAGIRKENNNSNIKTHRKHLKFFFFSSFFRQWRKLSLICIKLALLHTLRILL